MTWLRGLPWASALSLLCALPLAATNQLLVLQTDFGTLESSVATMKGVAMSVDQELKVFDLTHQIPPFDVWEAAYRLRETVNYWPPGTVFVSVVDPGVGTEQDSVAVRTRSGHYFVTPDNGTLTFVAEAFGIDEVRVIDLESQRLTGSSEFHTFHGRDVYAYVGARLAAGRIFFSQAGSRRKADEVLMIPYAPAEISAGLARGIIPVLDARFGNVWSTIPAGELETIGAEPNDRFTVTIREAGKLRYSQSLPLKRSFGEVAIGEPLVFVNNVGHLAVALNRGNFAETHDIGAGPDWTIEFRLP